MAQFNRRSHTIEARQHFGPKLNVMSALKGDQVAQSGDFLVVDPVAVQILRDREKFEGAAENSFGNKGTVYVVSKDEFLKEFDAEDATPALQPEKGFNVPDGLDVNAALVKSSGDGLDAGDWTQAAGAGLAYPSEPVLSQTTVYPNPLEPAVETEGATAPMLPGNGEVLTPVPEADLRDPSVPEVVTEEHN